MKKQTLSIAIAATFLSGCAQLAPENQVDLMITNGQVLTINADMDVIDNGVVVVKDDTIVAIGGQ